MICKTLRLLPPDTRIELKNPESFFSAINYNKSEIGKTLQITRQQIYRYRRGISKMNVEQLEKLSSIYGFDWKNEIKSFGLEASKHLIKLPETIKISERVAWLIGFHLTESSESTKNYGVCNTEINLIKEALDILRDEISLPEKLMRIEIRYNNGNPKRLIKNTSIALDFNENSINTRHMNDLKKNLYTLRINSRLVKEILDSIETEFINKIKRLPVYLESGYLRGLFDADGWFNKAKKIIVIVQKEKEIINFITELLESLDIDVRKEFWGYRNYHVCIVKFGKKGENLKSYMKKVGFLHPFKATRVKNSIAGLCRS